MDRKMKNSGFSLVELLVAIGIIAILVTVGVVAGGKAYRYINEKETMAYMEIINNAIMAYQEDTGYYPFDNMDAVTTDPVEVDFHKTNEAINSDFDSLFMTLRDNEFALERLKELPNEAFSYVDNDPNKEATGFVDAWGNQLYYSCRGGFGGTPVLISAGPDGKVYPSDSKNINAEDILEPDKKTGEEYYNKDNISSEK